MKTYRLAGGAVECDGRGLFVGGVALLKRLDTSAGFEPRAIAAINGELSHRYGARIDAAAKIGGFEFVASCLGRGELTLAQIGALMLRLPDPPLAFPKCNEEGRVELAAALDAAGLLKDDDFNEKHPRTGEPPNPAWFANKPKDTPPQLPAKLDPPRWQRWLQGALGWLERKVGFRIFLVRLIGVAAERVSFLASLDEYIQSLLADPSTQPSTGDVVADEIGAAKDPPKTLEELQKPPTHYQLGYDRHHIVEQNPANIAKRVEHWRLLLQKFGRAVIDDDSNLVWVARRNHWKVTAIYNSKELGDPTGRLHRQVVNELDFAAQREEGLKALRKAGVLK